MRRNEARPLAEQLLAQCAGAIVTLVGTAALQLRDDQIDEILEAIVKRIPAPKVPADPALRALIFDSWYDPYEGVIGLVRAFGGELRKAMKVRLMATGKEGEVLRLGHFTPHEREAESLSPGELARYYARAARLAPPDVLGWLHRR